MNIQRANDFLFTMDSKFRMISRDELLKEIEHTSNTQPIIIDLRSSDAFAKARLKGSINIQLDKLPELFHTINKASKIVMVCNGSIQSGYGIYYLYMQGFEDVYNLSGGFSGCENNNYELIEHLK